MNSAAVHSSCWVFTCTLCIAIVCHKLSADSCCVHAAARPPDVRYKTADTQVSNYNEPSSNLANYRKSNLGEQLVTIILQMLLVLQLNQHLWYDYATLPSIKHYQMQGIHQVQLSWSLITTRTHTLVQTDHRMSVDCAVQRVQSAYCNVNALPPCWGLFFLCFLSWQTVTLGMSISNQAMSSYCNVSDVPRNTTGEPPHE